MTTAHPATSAARMMRASEREMPQGAARDGPDDQVRVRYASVGQFQPAGGCSRGSRIASSSTKMMISPSPPYRASFTLPAGGAVHQRSLMPLAAIDQRTGRV